MKKMINLLFLAVSLMVASPAWAQFSIYVSPTGSDSNDCLTAATACKTPNVAIGRISKQVNTQVNVYFDQGNYYSPAYASDGGAPTAADLNGLIDLEGYTFGPGASLDLIGSTQQINTAGQVAGAIDAGVLGSPGVYGSWVQIAIDGGWGDYAIDAGYAYRDGGVGVLITNSLVGKFIQITSGSGSGLIAPITANDSRVITFDNYSTAVGFSPTAPDGTTKYNLFANASHLHPYPVDGGVSTSYAKASIFTAVAGPTGGVDVYAPNQTTRPLATSPAVTLNYLDIPDGPQGTNAHFESWDNYGGGLVSLRYSNMASTGGVSCLNDYSGAVELGADYVACNGGPDVQGQQGSTIAVTGSVLIPSAARAIDVAGSKTSVYNSMITPATAGTNPVRASTASELAIQSSLIDSNTTTVQAIQTLSGTNSILDQVSYITDGGSGFLSCGGNGTNSLLSNQPLDAGVNLYSLDNAVTWVTTTGFGLVDGGSNGVHATCSGGTGCCVLNY